MNDQSSKLGFSRAYSLSLAPELIYARSNLLPALVSSKAYQQLEFLAVCNWYIFDSDHDVEDLKAAEQSEAARTEHRATLRRIPGSREDVFADKTLDLRGTRSLMKFLKVAADPEAYTSLLGEWGDKPLTVLLSSKFNISPNLQAPLLALTLSLDSPRKIMTSLALPRIHRHLTSVGLFGLGFSSVIPKWGGLAEIAQVACRAGAVSGGVYVLNKGIKEVTRTVSAVSLRLDANEEIKTRWFICSDLDLPRPTMQLSSENSTSIFRSITIVASRLESLFPPRLEGASPAAGAVVFFPAGDLDAAQFPGDTEPSPTYLMIHSADTGECPSGQSKYFLTCS